MQCASIHNFNIHTVCQSLPALPSDVKASFAEALILPNQFHPYAMFSKAILVQSCVVGAVIAKYDEASGSVEIVAKGCLPAFAGFGFEDAAIAQIEADIARLKTMEECSSYDALIKQNSVHLTSNDVRLFQLRQALGGRSVNSVH